jgi:large repetitive protein
MSLIDLNLKRKSDRSKKNHPGVEVLETRECLSVAAPTGLTLSALSPTQVKLNWNDVAGESGYRVFQWNGSQAVLLTQLPANTKTFTASHLVPNQTQWFTVESFDLSTSARAAWVSINTPPQAITVPTNFHVAASTQTTVTLQWNFATGATGYRIFTWNGTSNVLVTTVANSTNSFQVTGLAPGGTYYYYLQAFNATNTASTDWITATTKATSITAPTSLKATPLSASTIGLSWKDALGETGYRIFRWDGNSMNNPVQIATLAANVTGYQATGLLPGKAYWFYVQAFNASASANSLWVNAVTLAAAPLGAPTQLTATVVGDNSVQLNWQEPARAVGYRVFVWAGLSSFQTQWFMVQAYTDNFAEVSYSAAVFVNL